MKTESQIEGEFDEGLDLHLTRQCCAHNCREVEACSIFAKKFIRQVARQAKIEAYENVKSLIGENGYSIAELKEIIAKFTK